MKTLILTDEQAIRLSMYLLMSTKYRQGEAEAWRELAQEIKADGTGLYPAAASNAEWWVETCRMMDKLKVMLDSAPYTDDTEASTERMCCK